MKSAGKARNNGLYRHIRTSKEIIRNLLNDFDKRLNLSAKCIHFRNFFHHTHFFQILCISFGMFHFL